VFRGISIKNDEKIVSVVVKQSMAKVDEVYGGFCL